MRKLNLEEVAVIMRDGLERKDDHLCTALNDIVEMSDE